MIEAREQFESNLPVDRPKTEPDIALYLPGEYLVLIEAKFTSPNTYYEPLQRKTPVSLTAAELIHRYWFREAQIVNPDAASDSPRVPQQLWRNTVFAEYMARQDRQGTRAYHANLVRHSFEELIECEFRQLLFPESTHRFRRVTWESLYEHTHILEGCEQLRDYLRNKSAGLQRAFQLPGQTGESVSIATQHGLFGVE